MNEAASGTIEFVCNESKEFANEPVERVWPPSRSQSPEAGRVVRLIFMVPMACQSLTQGVERLAGRMRERSSQAA